MITQEKILRLAYERDACEEGLEWYEERSREDILTWDAIENGYFLWVAENIPEAIPYLRTLPEDLKERALKADYFYIRRSMAFIGYKLEVLKDDPNCNVRIAVAWQGYALDQFKDDPDVSIRMEIVEQGYALEHLKDDPDWQVRWEVAHQGYALEQLKDDPSEFVRGIAREKLKEMQQ